MFKKISIGFAAGLICGLFSTGGGMIMVPGFMYILNKEPKLARATTSICILPMVLVSSFFYYKNDYINWNLSILCSIGGILGGIIGAYLLQIVNDKYLKAVFIIILIYTSIKMIN